VAADNTAALLKLETDDDVTRTQDSARSFTSSGLLSKVTDDNADREPGRKAVLDTVVTSSEDGASGTMMTCLTPLTQTSTAFVVTQLDSALDLRANACT